MKLISLLKSPLSPEEINKMVREESLAGEPDTYTQLMRTYTQRNTEALIKCKPKQKYPQLDGYLLRCNIYQLAFK